jgi:hypothetical protein
MGIQRKLGGYNKGIELTHKLINNTHGSSFIAPQTSSAGPQSVRWISSTGVGGRGVILSDIGIFSYGAHIDCRDQRLERTPKKSMAQRTCTSGLDYRRLGVHSIFCAHGRIGRRLVTVSSAQESSLC